MSEYLVRDSAIETYLGGEGKPSVVKWTRCVFVGKSKVSTDFMERSFATEAEATQFSRLLYSEFQTPAFDQIEANFWDDGSDEYYLKGKRYEREIG